ncbi:MAG: hypothetical protein QOD76_1099 [Solirubrobacteraceae bacterium]|jgi:hypothetical protein|nr:hypothetical protein [Solirubrobacteraceae bacterium]
MYARVAKWEGADGEAMRSMAEQVNADADAGPPEGVPAKGFMMFIDTDNGRSLGIALFDTEEDMRKGDEALNAMNPPTSEGMGQRTSVEMYEVAADLKA